MENKDCIAIYSRKSKFTGKGESIGNQIELCRNHIALQYGQEYLNNDRVLVFEDEGFSGGNTNRPAFKKMMEAAEKHEFKAIVVYRLDRISRNIGDFSNLIQKLSALDISFVSISEQFDTVSPMGRAMMYISSVFAQLERETIAERIRDNMHELAKTGRWLGGNTPTGYESEAVKTVTLDGKQRSLYQLKIVPSEAETVKQIFLLFQTYKSLTKVESELTRQHIKTKRGNPYTRFALKGILQNPVYMIADAEAYRYFCDRQANLYSDEDEFDGQSGMMVYNRTDQVKGRSVKLKPQEEWIVSVGKHEGLVTGKDWIAVQDELERNRDKAYRKPRKNEALLTGLIYCRCGSRMYPKLSRQELEDGRTAFSYVCKQKDISRGENCKIRNVSGNLLDDAVIEEIKRLSEDKALFAKQMERNKKSFSDHQDNFGNKIKELRSSATEAEKMMNSLLDSLGGAESTAVRKRLMQKIHELDDEIQGKKEKIRELESIVTRQELSQEEFDILRDTIASFAATVDQMSVEQKREAIKALVRKVIWDGENAHVILFGDPDGEIEYPDLSDRFVQPGETEKDASLESVTRLCGDSE